MPTVSVVIPTYNRAAYVRACVESVLAQTFDDYEIIVIDDGSTDNTRDLLQPWIRTGKISYYYQDNKGPSGARNAGFNRAAGELIAFLDSDDLWPPDKLEWQVRYMREHPDAGVVGGGYEVFDESTPKKRPPALQEGDISFEDAFGGGFCFVNAGATLIRAGILRKAGGFDERCRLSEDLDLWLKLLREGCRIVRVPRLALYYRSHSTNISANMLAMYQSGEFVLRKHIGFIPRRDRARMACRAYAFLYDYRGERVIQRCKAKIRRGDGSDLFPVAAVLLRLIRVALLDPRFIRRIFKDVFIPARFRSPEQPK
jgi:glycosyltransferase involved in cell wall biosynthesis